MMMYSIKDVADMLGVSRGVINRARQSGEITFRSLPTKYGRSLQCERRELIGWMTRIGFPVDMYRHKLAVSRHLLACGISQRIVSAMYGVKVEVASSPMSLGMLLAKKSPWAIMLGFDGVGREIAMSIATDIRRDPGRPYLIAILGDDDSSRPGRAADLFDLVLPNDVSDQRAVRAVRSLRDHGYTEGR